jgi:GH15 family glucan-1,4-alpha-glucosidase
MPLRIEDYAMIGDGQTAALVGKDGSIDWLCVPRFDSGACFAALLGTPEHGRWQLAPTTPVRSVSRRYRPGTLVLETDIETEQGTVTLIDCMPRRSEYPTLVRIVAGKAGAVSMRMHLVIRFDYGSIVPWVTRHNGGIQAVGGPDRLVLHTPVELHGEDLTTVAEFTVQARQRVPFTLEWRPSHLPVPEPADPEQTLHETAAWWRRWSKRCAYEGLWRDAVLRSLITLKALAYTPTGGIVAAPTTSLPEWPGGVRNWDYRFCWLRDATFTLYALLMGGYIEEARAWREWLLRAVAGQPRQANIMYGLGGERRLTELELDWLPGYEGSRPVRVGNAAHRQFQLDVYGEVLDAMTLARRKGLEPSPHGWAVGRKLVGFLETAWKEADEGIWEVRGPRRHFTHSKVMAWVAVDRMVKAAESQGPEAKAPIKRWRALRRTMHEEICKEGYDASRNTFVQYYGAKELDASLLMIPLVGFLPARDRRVRGTVEAIERELLHDGFVHRYVTAASVDGLPPGEGVFLPCSFWLADNYQILGRTEEARELFERLLGLCNDVGLIAEEYDPANRRLLGNFPQAFTHVALVNSASNLTQESSPAGDRARS